MASLRKPSRPRYKAMPKAPKITASDESWKAFEKRVQAVIAENQKRKSDYEKKLKSYDASIKLRNDIKAKMRAAKAKL